MSLLFSFLLQRVIHPAAQEELRKRVLKMDFDKPPVKSSRVMCLNKSHLHKSLNISAELS
jgi:hypothetical protein